MSAIIEAEQVTRILPGADPVTLVRDVSLAIHPGEFVGIQGPSGSGKSSLLYLLGLLDVPTTGKVRLDGMDTSTLDDDALTHVRLEKLGFVFQFHFLLTEFSTLENVRLPMAKLGRLTPAEQHDHATRLLFELGLGDHIAKHPSQLSGGQRQRVAIARALANDPLVILADEPTGNLDSASSANVRDIFREIAHVKKRAVIAVTHDADFASGADRIVHIVDGRITDVPGPRPMGHQATSQ